MAAPTNMPSTDLSSPKDRGTSLIMAMIFLTVGALLVVSLARFATTNLADSNSLITTRVMNYAGDGALDGAIQWNRYHPSCSENFPSAGSLKLSTGEYVLVTCSNVSNGLITAEATQGSTQLTSPSPSFPTNPDYAISNPPVTGPGSPAFQATIVAVASATTATMSQALNLPGLAAGTHVTVTVGASGLVVDDFSTCVSNGPITSPCGNPESTAAVAFDNDVSSSGMCDGVTVPPGTPLVTGCNASILRWSVNDAND